MLLCLLVCVTVGAQSARPHHVRADPARVLTPRVPLPVVMTDDQVDVWSRYELRIPPSGCHPASLLAIAPLVHVLSVASPAGVALDPVEDLRLEREFTDLMLRWDVPWCHCLGCDPRTGSSEPGFVVLGLPRPAVLRLAAHFTQSAFYEFSPETALLVETVTSRLIEIPAPRLDRSSRRSSCAPSLVRTVGLSGPNR